MSTVSFCHLFYFNNFFSCFILFLAFISFHYIFQTYLIKFSFPFFFFFLYTYPFLTLIIHLSFPRLFFTPLIPLSLISSHSFPPPSLSLSFSPSHSPPLILSFSPSHSPLLFLSSSPSHSPPLFLPLSFSHSLPLFLLLSPSHPHSHTQFAGTQALVFVVDSSDRDRIAEAKTELHRIVSDKDMKDAIILGGR